MTGNIHGCRERERENVFSKNVSLEIGLFNIAQKKMGKVLTCLFCV